MNPGFDDLKGKVCVITGGAGVIGSALVRALACVGVKISILDINLDAAQKVASDIAQETGAKIIGVKANVLDKDSLVHAMREVKDALGPIGLLIRSEEHTS